MITLPKEFCTTKWPGYFWNINDKQLYSVKVTGMLKPLKKTFFWSAYTHGQGHIPGYSISVNGRKRFVSIKTLEQFKPTKAVYPVYTEQLEIL